jgi:CheY-like chemotaxis protein
MGYSKGSSGMLPFDRRMRELTSRRRNMGQERVLQAVKLVYNKRRSEEDRRRTTVTKILMVDDEPCGIQVLTQYLTEAGYDVMTATNGKEAWKILTEHPKSVDVLISDWMMPEMSGIELLAKIQRQEKLKQIPVIMLTSLHERDEIIQAVQTGVFDYLTKPVDKDLLLSMVERAIL